MFPMGPVVEEPRAASVGGVSFHLFHFLLLPFRLPHSFPTFTFQITLIRREISFPTLYLPESPNHFLLCTFKIAQLISSFVSSRSLLSKEKFPFPTLYHPDCPIHFLLCLYLPDCSHPRRDFISYFCFLDCAL